MESHYLDKNDPLYIDQSDIILYNIKQALSTGDNHKHHGRLFLILIIYRRN